METGFAFMAWRTAASKFMSPTMEILMITKKIAWLRRQVNKAAEISPSVRARASIQSQRMFQSCVHGFQIRQMAENGIHFRLENCGEIVGHNYGIQSQSGGFAFRRIAADKNAAGGAATREVAGNHGDDGLGKSAGQFVALNDEGRTAPGGVQIGIRKQDQHHVTAFGLHRKLKLRDVPSLQRKFSGAR